MFAEKKKSKNYHVKAKEATFTTFRDAVRHILMFRDWMAENGLDDSDMPIPEEVYLRPGEIITVHPSLETDDAEIATLYKLRFG